MRARANPRNRLKATLHRRRSVNTLKARRSERSEGQTLVLFGAALFAILGFVAMSVDVGRLVWARTQMQSSVDASALAAAQSMPNTAKATADATRYWSANSPFQKGQAVDPALTVSFPDAGKRSVHVRGDADVPTVFARVFGIQSWHVSAEAQAESQVVDGMLVLDRSASMCWDSHGRVGSCLQAGPGPYHPWEEVKTGGELFVGQFNPGYDRIGFVQFSTWAEIETPLAAGLAATASSVSGAPDPSTQGPDDGRTNIAHGFYLANRELVNESRNSSHRVVILLSDGVANTHCSPVAATATCNSWGTNENAARQAALAEADFAAANGITVYTIGYGNSADDALMKEIADRTGGEFYKAPNGQTLAKAFLAISEITKIRLTL